MEIVLKDECERRVILAGLWGVAAKAIGERFDDLLYTCAGEDGTDKAPDKAYADARIAALVAVRADIDHVDAAPVDETILLSVLPDQLTEALADYRLIIEELENFWQSTSGKREELMAKHDAATALLKRLATPAEAVA